MDPYLPAWALVLLGPALLLPGDPEPPPEQLCGVDFVRMLVRVCGGPPPPRWSSGARQSVTRGDRELLKWLEGHLLQGLMADGELMLAPGPQTLPQASLHHHRHRRATANNPAHRYCLSGCAQQNLPALCPH
ncbi:PREDICTED: insulin-like 3 [Chrysochloris asiatica]|uniref:Insulin-like 3 n=1 Tax=Chrysochloris asiatica TaxID=185453 RepID=A0A9B0UA97_CHRAS|nr:PREDICTED: insulin-like 3 [Chrysochloris asiatica]